MQKLVRGEVEALASIFKGVNGIYTFLEYVAAFDDVLSPELRLAREQALWKTVEDYLTVPSSQKEGHTARVRMLWSRVPPPRCLYNIEVHLKMDIEVTETGIPRRIWTEEFSCVQRFTRKFIYSTVVNYPHVDDSTCRRVPASMWSQSGIDDWLSDISGTNAPETTLDTASDLSEPGDYR
jgi:hypothetical protein